MDNKDYIINIRVSKDTYNKLKRKAKENGESLSNLVRKTVDDGLEIFEDLKKDLFNPDNKNDNFAHFQNVILAKENNCARCGSLMLKGARVFAGETKSGQTKYICQECFSGDIKG